MSTPARVWQLRPDLEILPAEPEAGIPAVLVHDPQSGVFHRVEWPECDLVESLRHAVTAEALRERFSAANPLKPSGEDVLGYLAELGRRGWLRDSRFRPARRREPPRPGVLAILARILFLRLPLIRPERFLKATAGLAGLLRSRAAEPAFLFCGLAGVCLTLPRWEDYWRDSLGGLSPGNVSVFLLILALVKTVHEFAHAYAATLAGARVSTMGIALFFFAPLPFTDVSDAWRLPWRRRLGVAAAGMRAEAALACLALPGWALSPPGAAAQTLARLSSLVLVSTLLTNLNPGPRFDGYYILVCLCRMENLRERGIAELRRSAWPLFLGVPPPGGGGSPGRRRGVLLAYAMYSLSYRVTLGFALAAAAYYLFPKAVGLPIAAAELWLFVGAPASAEAALLARSIRKMRPTIPFFILSVFAAAVAVWFFGSWPRRIAFPAVTRARTEEALRSRASGEAARVSAARGRETSAGDELAALASPFHDSVLRQAEWALAEAELAEEQAWRDGHSRSDTLHLAAETERRRAETEAIRLRGDYLRVVSPADGEIAIWDDALKPGVSTARGRVLGWVVGGPVDALSCYARMDQSRKLEVGSEIRFFPDSGEGWVGGRIVRIEESRPETLEDAALAGVLGAEEGPDGVLPLREPYARIRAVLEIRGLERPLRAGQTGTARAWTRPESLAAEAWNWFSALAVRESDF